MQREMGGNEIIATYFQFSRPTLLFPFPLKTTKHTRKFPYFSTKSKHTSQRLANCTPWGVGVGSGSRVFVCVQRMGTGVLKNSCAWRL